MCFSLLCIANATRTICICPYRINNFYVINLIPRYILRNVANKDLSKFVTVRKCSKSLVKFIKISGGFRVISFGDPLTALESWNPNYGLMQQPVRYVSVSQYALGEAETRDRDHDRFSTIFLLLLESSTNFLSLPKETPYANVTRYSPRNFWYEYFKAEEVKINTSPHGEHVGSVQPQ